MQYINANNDCLKQLSVEFDVPYFDVGPFSPDCFLDELHFNKKGLEEMANKMAINIKPIVENLMKNSNNNNFS